MVGTCAITRSSRFCWPLLRQRRASADADNGKQLAVMAVCPAIESLAGLVM